MVYHITTQARWNSLAADPYFAPEGYAREKFIHCCEEHQIEGVLGRYFFAVDNLLMLYIDESKLERDLVYEPSTNNELFPHLYGMINKTAIVLVENIRS
jgi:uncharacterized protein (DUF952 family)